MKHTNLLNNFLNQNFFDFKIFLVRFVEAKTFKTRAMKSHKRLTIYFENKTRDSRFRTTEAIHDVYSISKCNELVNHVCNERERKGLSVDITKVQWGTNWMRVIQDNSGSRPSYAVSL